MRLWTIRIAVVVGLLAIHATGQETTTYEYASGRWFNGRTFVMRTFYSVGGVLHPNKPIFKIEKSYDLGGAYVIPACGEAHNHNATKSNPEALSNYVAKGILYVENPTNLPEEREKSEVLNGPKGPDVIFSNGQFTAPGGHPIGLVKRNIERGNMTEAQGEGAFYYTISSVTDLEKKFPSLLSTKPDFVKLTLVYSEDYVRRKDDEGYFSRKGLAPALVAPIVAKAHAAHLRVMAHVESAYDFSVATKAGVDQIVHMPGFWPDDATLKGGSTAKYQIADDDARLAARKKIVVITTLGELLDNTDKLKDGAIAKKLVDMAKSNVEILRRHRVRIAIGSDQFRSDSREEALRLMKHGFFDPPSMLNAWCSLTPRVIFPNRKIGELKDGYEANFVVLEADPLTTPEALVAPPVMVFKHGEQIFKRAAIK